VYFSLYWRARFGINNLARVHHVTANIDRSATVWQEVEYEPSGQSYTVPDWVDWEFTIPNQATSGIPWGGFPPPGPTLRQGFAGLKLPVAKAPADATPEPTGTESVYSGRGTFYRCVYGDHEVLMNTTTDRPRVVRVEYPAVDLGTGRMVRPGQPVSVGPRSTLVLYRSGL